MLDSLYIQNFRLFQKLEIEKLGRVNLIVGMNNSGKSCLLEALYLYATKASAMGMYQLVKARGEDWELKLVTRGEITGPVQHPFKAFFPSYQFPDSDNVEIVIGSGKIEENRIKLRVGSGDTNQLTLFGELDSRIVLARWYGNDFLGYIDLDDHIASIVQFGTYKRSVSTKELLSNGMEKNVRIVSSNTLPNHESLASWDRVNLEPHLRQKVFDALRILDEDIREVVIIGQEKRMTPIILYKSKDIKVPLKSLGDGVNHLFHMVLALVNSRNGVLLIDEFETGLHYSIQGKVWEIIFKIAEELDIHACFYPGGTT
jgi:AAA15 family ATPase/GTPase